MTSLRIGIIGVGNMGGIHARILGNLRQLVAIADTDLDRANEVASKHGVEAFESYETMIESASINCVIISTPTSTHAKIAEEIARKYEGIKGILIEKPIASSYKDAKRVAKVLRDKGISTVVSHSEIYNPVARILEFMTSISWPG
jgi:predicted dehydrogenase